MCSYPLIEPTVSPQNIMHVIIKVLKTILDSLGSNQDGIHIFQYVMNQQSFALISIPILNTLIYDYMYMYSILENVECLVFWVLEPLVQHMDHQGWYLDVLVCHKSISCCSNFILNTFMYRQISTINLKMSSTGYSGSQNHPGQLMDHQG